MGRRMLPPIKDRAHIRIDVIMHYLGPRAKALLYIFGDHGDVHGVASYRALLVLGKQYWSLRISGPSRMGCGFPRYGS